MIPAGFRGIVNDVVAIYVLGVRLAGAFVARWCAGRKAEIMEGAFQGREDGPEPVARLCDDRWRQRI